MPNDIFKVYYWIDWRYDGNVLVASGNGALMEIFDIKESKGPQQIFGGFPSSLPFLPEWLWPENNVHISKICY